MEDRFDFKNLFETLKNKSDSLLEEKTSNLSEKTKKYIEIYVFEYDMGTIVSKNNRFLKVNLIAKSIQNYFEERNLLIERLTKGLGNF